MSDFCMTASPTFLFSPVDELFNPSTLPSSSGSGCRGPEGLCIFFCLTFFFFCRALSPYAQTHPHHRVTSCPAASPAATLDQARREERQPDEATGRCVIDGSEDEFTSAICRSKRRHSSRMRQHLSSCGHFYPPVWSDSTAGASRTL